MKKYIIFIVAVSMSCCSDSKPQVPDHCPNGRKILDVEIIYMHDELKKDYYNTVSEKIAGAFENGCVGVKSAATNYNSYHEREPGGATQPGAPKTKPSSAEINEMKPMNESALEAFALSEHRYNNCNIGNYYRDAYVIMALVGWTHELWESGDLDLSGFGYGRTVRVLDQNNDYWYICQIFDKDILWKFTGSYSDATINNTRCETAIHELGHVFINQNVTALHGNTNACHNYSTNCAMFGYSINGIDLKYCPTHAFVVSFLTYNATIPTVQ